MVHRSTGSDTVSLLALRLSSTEEPLCLTRVFLSTGLSYSSFAYAGLETGYDKLTKKYPTVGWVEGNKFGFTLAALYDWPAPAASDEKTD